MKKRAHTAIMTKEITEMMPADSLTIFDGTLGHGGHAVAMLKTCEKARLVGVDRDQNMLSTAKQNLADYSERVTILHECYDHLNAIIEQTSSNKFDFMLLDIGINRGHIVEADRGFSIKKDGPLDMRFDQTTGNTAKELLDDIKHQTLIEGLQKYGDFGPKKAEELGHHILRCHNKQSIDSTFVLKDTLKQVGIGEKKCAVVFQVIRILVNHELEHLENFLADYYKYMNVGGRCAIITFHSVEDRIVKQSFKSQEEAGIIQRINKKVIIPHRKERQRNKASKSAKLRVVEKT